MQSTEHILLPVYTYLVLLLYGVYQSFINNNNSNLYVCMYITSLGTINPIITTAINHERRESGNIAICYSIRSTPYSILHIFHLSGGDIISASPWGAKSDRKKEFDWISGRGGTYLVLRTTSNIPTVGIVKAERKRKSLLRIRVRMR